MMEDRDCVKEIMDDNIHGEITLYLELLEGRERGDLGKSLEDEGTKIISLFFKKKIARNL